MTLKFSHLLSTKVILVNFVSNRGYIYDKMYIGDEQKVRRKILLQRNSSEQEIFVYNSLVTPLIFWRQSCIVL